MRELRQRGNRGFETLEIFENSKEQDLKDEEVKIKMKALGLNQRDIYIINNHNKTNADFVIGSDGAGKVIDVGEKVQDIKIGDEVIINPVTNWQEKENPPLYPNILGFPDNGVFSENVVINESQVFLKPSSLDWEEAASLSLSALTAYRLLFTKGKLQSKQKVLIPGISGSVALLAAQMARKLNCTVIGTSRKQSDISVPVNKIINTNKDFQKQLDHQKFDLILDSLGEKLFDKYMDIIKPNGNIVLFGASSGDNLNIYARDIFYPQINILGSSVGSREEYIEMYNFIAEYNIKPIIGRTFKFNDIITGLKELKSKQQIGNIAIIFEDN